MSKILEIVASELENYLNTGTTHAVRTKRLAGQVNDIKIEVHGNEHDPPHFHVRSKQKNYIACFYIEDCSFWKNKVGYISNSDTEKVRIFLTEKRPDLWKFLKKEHARMNQDYS